MAQLDREIRELEAKSNGIEEYITRTESAFEQDFKERREAHDEKCAEMRQEIVKIKFELDKVLSVKIAA